jgi:hypothetical protein
MMSVAITEIVHCGPWAATRRVQPQSPGSADKVARLFARLGSQVEAKRATFEGREIHG